MADLFDKMRNDELINRAKEASEIGMYPYFRALSHSEGVTATFEGKEVVMLGSNNYLGLTTDQRVRQAAIDAIKHLHAFSNPWKTIFIHEGKKPTSSQIHRNYDY